MLALAVALGATTCAVPEPKASNLVPASEAPDARFVYVAMGSDETVLVTPTAGGAAAGPATGPTTVAPTTSPAEALTRTWVHRLLDALPPGANQVDLSERDVTAERAARDQLPRAVALQPSLVTVWLGPADERADTADERFRDALDAILTALRPTAPARVLVLTRPAGTPGGRYAGIVTQAATAHGATVVVLPAEPTPPTTTTTPATGSGAGGTEPTTPDPGSGAGATTTATTAATTTLARTTGPSTATTWPSDVAGVADAVRDRIVH